MALTMGDLGKDTKSSLGDGYLYRFDQFALDSRKRTLSRADSPVSLTPKAFDVLLFLAQNPNRLVTKEELLQAVWGDTFVEEGNLKQYISHLRKALGDNSGAGAPARRPSARIVYPWPIQHSRLYGQIIQVDLQFPISQIGS